MTMGDGGLTQGAVERIVAGETGFEPTLQCIDIKKVNSAANQGPERYRVTLSDGQWTTLAVLSNQMSEIARNNVIQTNSVVRLKDFLVNSVSNAQNTKRMAIVVNLEVLGTPEHVIGQPRSLKEGPAGNATGDPGNAGAASGGPGAPAAAGGAAAAGGGGGGGYGAPPPANNYNGGNSGGYGGGGAGGWGGYGAPPPGNSGGYGAGGAGGGGGGYGAPPGNSGGYGAGAAAAGGGGGYGAPPPNNNAGGNTGGYGAPPGNNNNAGGGGGGYGAPPPNNGGNNGGYGGPPPNGGYGGGAAAAGGGGGGGGGFGRGAGFGGGNNAGGRGGYGANPRFAGNGPIARDEAAPRVVPIRSLNPYQTRWTIRARVTAKSEVKHWHNARGDGKLFSIDLLDEDGGEIRAVAFNDTCDQLYSLVDAGEVYLVSKGSLKPKRAAFNHLNSEFEITLESGSLIERCSPEDPNVRKIKTINYDLRKLRQVEDMQATAVVDVLGVVENVGPETSITRKDGSEARKRGFVIRDDSQRSIEVTLWGTFASNPGNQLEAEAANHPIVAVKAARVGDFNGKTLSTIGSSVVTINPDIPDAGALRQWYDTVGRNDSNVTALSAAGGGGRNDRRVTLTQIADEGLGTRGQADFVNVLGTISYIRSENMSYPACSNDSTTNPGRKCAKKLIDNGNDTWYCEKCAAQSQVDWRYIMSVTALDHTGNSWLTLFNESGVELMDGTTAADLKMIESDDRFDELIQAANFKMLRFSLRVNQEEYNDEQRIKTTVRSIAPVNFAQESKELLKNIGVIKAGQPLYPPVQQSGAGHQPQHGAGAPQRGGGGYGAPQGGGGGYGGGGGGGYGGGGGGYAAPPGGGGGYGGAAGGGGGYGGGGGGGYAAPQGGGGGYGGGGGGYNAPQGGGGGYGGGSGGGGYSSGGYGGGGGGGGYSGGGGYR